MKKIIHTSNAPEAVGPYSQAVEINGMLFISGQVPLDPDTADLVEEDIKIQTERVMENIATILKAAGYDFNDVVKTTCLLTDISNFKPMNEVYARYFRETPPARAAFAVKSLPLGALIEIETIAIKEKSSVNL